MAERAHGLKSDLAALARDDAEARGAIAARVEAFDRDWRELDRLIEAQNWRVAFFRVAEDEINYRRFFNINDLAGLRMELAPVFLRVHERVLAMLRASEIEGLRIDHIDGLLDPKAYLTALREHANQATADAAPSSALRAVPLSSPGRSPGIAGEDIESATLSSPAKRSETGEGDHAKHGGGGSPRGGLAVANQPFYLVVEKILAPHESLRADWPVEGGTGYDFVNQALGLMIDPSAEAAFDESWRAFAGPQQTFAAVAVASKLRIMDHEMASELAALGRAAARLAKSSPMTVDLTRGILVRAIRQTLANFPVYRTYIDLAGAPDEADLRDIAWAIARARRGDPGLHPSAFDVLEAVLTGNAASLRAKELSRTAALRFAMRLQQASGPVMAKGVEDTAFYRWNRFIALNEVGGTPDRFGIAPQAFHKAVLQRAGRWPHAMLATATHDTKRGEDARARLAVLSERPEEWRRQVTAWSRLLRARIGDVEGVAAPDRNDEYMFWQMLVGSWPPDMLDNPTPDALAAFAERIRGALTKSMREAKLNSGWAAPNALYEDAMLAFAAEALRPDASGFLSAFLPFVADVARLGAQNSLVQTVLKLTVPGVPDTYQGSELWDFSLVDPDNRRPVDYSARAAALEEVEAQLAASGRGGRLFDSLMESWRDGRIKLATISLLLALRRERPDLFAEGDYRPLEIAGEEGDWAIGFLRQQGAQRLAVVAALYPAKRAAKPGWEAIARLAEGRWIDHLRASEIDAKAPLGAWLGALPVAVLTEG